MAFYNDFKSDTRRAVINLIDSEFLQCTFYEDNQIVGAIEYPDKSYFYVRDAAENWINGVMSKDTVRYYTKQLDFFSK